jgi:RNA polymerase sigma factor (sigma-70 family)
MSIASFPAVPAAGANLLPPLLRQDPLARVRPRRDVRHPLPPPGAALLPPGAALPQVGAAMPQAGAAVPPPGAALPPLAAAMPQLGAALPAPQAVHSPAATFHANHALIEEAIAAVVRRRGVLQQEAEDFAATVCLRLLEDDCSVLRKFEGRSSLRTFLRVVVERMLLDYRIAKWGKWRPSTEARRLGPVAVRLETLTSREGLSFWEAVETLRTNHRLPHTGAELWRLFTLLPAKPRRRTVAEAELSEMAATGHAPEATPDRRHAACTHRALRQAVARLTAEERLMLEQRFDRGLRLAQIADLRGLEHKTVYRRFAALLRRLRADLEAQGIAGAEVEGWLGRLEMSDGRLGLFPAQGGRHQAAAHQDAPERLSP